MKERPILFSGPMVRAILDGRKTQTRRVVRVQGEGYRQTLDADKSLWLIKGGGRIRCPYGEPGDRLWVRETFRCNGWATDVATIFYRANERNSYTEMCEHFPVDGKKPLPVDGRWRPSIYMPRWASRITLEIKSISVERLQDISEEDALAEGIVETDWGTEKPRGSMSVDGGKTYHEFKERQIPHRFHAGDATSPEQCLTRARWAFASLWQSINGPDSWDANPWVWVVEFERADMEYGL